MDTQEKPKGTPIKEPAPAPQPAPDVAATARKNIAAVKTGHDPLRPVRMGVKFVHGTLRESFNGMATYGRKGLWVGIGLGIIAGIATGGLSYVFGVALAGLASGMAFGTAKGALTGGMGEVGRDYRAHKYAEDLVQRRQVQDNAGPNRHDYRAAYRNQQLTNSYNTQQLLERTRERTGDFNTYWQDREADRANRLPQEKGHGF